jgi:glycosyltransferase involved in cell wall biosynthesis
MAIINKEFVHNQGFMLANSNVTRFEKTLGRLPRTLKPKSLPAMLGIMVKIKDESSGRVMEKNAITLCLVVKNELNNIKSYVGRTFNMFDAVVITDTGSDDGTVELLRSEYGIEPTLFGVSEKNHFSILDVRNYNIRLANTDYIFVLDADETVAEDDVHKMRSAIEMDLDADGFFLNWNTYKRDCSPIKDYKLNLFKNDPSIHFIGERHPYVTVSIRDNGGHAEWIDAEIKHFPDLQREYQKLKHILPHLYELVVKDPEFFRYHWFLGMTLYSLDDREKAVPFLEDAAHSKSLRFPVECLNSHLLLAEVYYDNNKKGGALDTVESALAFYQKVRDDFEVKVNFRMLPTLEKLKEDIMSGENRLSAYPFGGV